jgi:hypothetical protein
MRLRRLGPDSLYVLTGLPLALVSFVVLVAGLALGIGLLITLLGIPVAALTLNVADLLVDVLDDGHGGAHPAKGHGLAGLIDRLAGLDGGVAVDSPPGGPTRVTATLPCA